MSNIAIPNSFSPNTVIQSALVNANFAAIANEYNSHAVQTDVAKTITVSHTFSASQTFSGGIAVTGAFGLANTATLAPTLNTTSGATTDLIEVFFQRGGVNKWRLGTNINAANVDIFSIYNDGLAADVLAFSNSTGIATLARGLVISAGGIAATGASTITGTLGGITTLTASTVNATSVGGTLTTAAQPNVTSVGVLSGLTVSGAGLSVAANGATITGNSSITGNLVVTGSISAVTGSNNYVRRTTDLNFTTNTDFTFSFAIGAAEEWEFEYVLQHTNAGAATASFQVTGPAAAVGFFGGLSTISGAPSAVQGAVQQTLGNVLVGFTMNATSGYTHIRGYAKGGGTSGNIAINGTASAGTGVLKSGSYVRYSRIA